MDAYKTPPQGHGISLPHKLVKKMHHKRNNMNLQKSMLGRISTSVVSQISSSLFSPSILIKKKKKRLDLEMWVKEEHCH